MMNFKLVFFKIPPEITSFIKKPKNQFFPSNYAQLISFNCSDYCFAINEINNDLVEINNLVDIRLAYNSTLLNNLLGFTIKSNEKKVRKRIYAAYNWGVLMKSKNKIVLAWNKNDPESMALSKSGVRIIWLENGYSRSSSFYFDSNFKLKLNDFNFKSTQRFEYNNQKFSILFNSLDLIFDLRDRYGALGYYSQIFNKRINKNHNKKKIKLDKSYLNLVFLGQLDYDYNTIVCGNNFDMRKGVENFNNLIIKLNSSGIKSKGYVRFHPNNLRSHKQYKRCFPEIEFDYSSNMQECSSVFDLAVTINSSASVYFIKKLKPVIFLGEGEFVDYMKKNIIQEFNFNNISYEGKSYSKIMLKNLNEYLNKYHISKKYIKELIVKLYD